MNEELILRNYLFHFLRSPEYKTDVNFYLPKFLTKDAAFSETQRTLSEEHEKYRLKVIDFAKQFHPQTATWGLNVWEEELGLPTDLNLDLELRRAKVMAKLLGASPMTVANTNKLVNLFTDDGKAYVDELPTDGTIKVIIPSKTAYVDEMRESLAEMLPAHLVFDFQHIIEIDGDEENDDTGKTDDLKNINDEDSAADINGSAFFMHADFPIFENIPYGSWYDAPKYNGSVVAKMANMLDGATKYDGENFYSGINSETEKVGKYCKWWFIPTGKSSFNKEFRCNGAIRYDGLRPREIEYDDGMDELENFQLTKIIDEKVVGIDQFNGNSTFNGAVIANENELPTDSGGDIEIKHFRVFDGAIKYNGGNLNYFNGSIKADGKFDFTGNGVKAEIEILTDRIDGKLNYIRPEKETLPFSYQEIFDFVPVITEKQSTNILTATINDAVKDISDDYNALKILRVSRYDGAKDYGGGNLNYFNGTIKADGKFNFESGGTQAQTKLLAIDLDGKFSLFNPNVEKVTPPFVYVENFDLVPAIYEKARFSVQTIFEDNFSPTDGNGNLTIRKRAKFDGVLSYAGNFEYAADSSRRFNGGLNYNGVYKVEVCGDTQFNGSERYGGRKNHNFIEYVTALDGDIPFVDFENLEKIPVATSGKLGFITAGYNIDINDNGEISLPERFKSQPLIEIQAGVLPTLFENWRRKNET